MCISEDFSKALGQRRQKISAKNLQDPEEL